MIVLNGSTQKLIIVSDTAASVEEVRFMATYATIAAADKTALTDVNTSIGLTNGTTDMDLVPAPSGSDERDIKYIALHNDDTTTHTLSIIYDDNGTQYELWHGTLKQSQSATYSSGFWTVYDVDGATIGKSATISHGSTHQNGGVDEINVAGLSGLLADGQTPLAHAASHIRAGTDEIDGDVLDIDFTPSNYTPDTTPGEVTDVDELSAHLAGIDNQIGTNATNLSDHEADTANPHATDVGNLGSGTLAELNTAITDATLDDSGDPRTRTHSAFNDLKSYESEKAKYAYFNADDFVSEVKPTFLYEFPTEDSRTQFLKEHGMLEFARGN